MRNNFLYILLLCVGIFVGTGCCKDKKSCKGGEFQIHPFIERYAKFECQNNNEYTYIFRNSKQIDSLQPTCSFAVPVAFPIDETNMIYFIIGKGSYHRRDTFNTSVVKDTCFKTLTYQVDMIQRDTATWEFPGGVQSMFCAVQNIPADYKVEVKYKYVPL
jgi:hypothetical protein